MLYEENFRQYMDGFNRNLTFEEKKAEKLEKYIFREQEYRRVIEDLKAEIDRVGQKPLKEKMIQSEDQKAIESIQNQLNKNRGENGSRTGETPFGDKIALDPKDKNIYPPPEGEFPKYVTNIHQYRKEIDKDIKDFQDQTQKEMMKRRNDLIQQMDKMLSEHFQHLREENQKKNQDIVDPYEQEKELKDALEKMTAMAQALDEKNRKLVLKNQQLDIDFKSQEDDRKILLQQILYYKNN